MDKNKKTGYLIIGLGVAFTLLSVILSYALISSIVEKVPMQIANQYIKAGTPINESMFSIVEVPVKGRPKDAILPGEDLTGYVAITDFGTNDILRYTKVVNLKEKDLPIISTKLRGLDPEALTNENYETPEMRKLRAVELPIESIEGMLPGMKPGDKLAITSVYTERAPGGIEQKHSEPLFDYVEVLDIRLPSDENSKGTLVIALTQKQFQAFALARDKGTFYVALMPYGLEKPKGHPEILSEYYLLAIGEDLSEEYYTTPTNTNEYQVGLGSE